MIKIIVVIFGIQNVKVDTFFIEFDVHCKYKLK